MRGVIEDAGLADTSKKELEGQQVIKALDLCGKRVTLVVDDDAVIEYLSFRNIDKVEVIAACEANTRNLLDNKALMMSLDVARKFEEALA